MSDEDTRDLHEETRALRGHWRCGKCEQEAQLAEGKEVGELIPSHFRTCSKRMGEAPIIEPTEHVQLPTQIVYVGAKPPDIAPVALDCSGMLPKGAAENLEYGEQVMRELKEPMPGAAHFPAGIVEPTELQTQLRELAACIIRCGDPDKGALMLEMLVHTAQTHAIESVLRERR